MESKLINHRAGKGKADGESRRKINPSALSLGMLKRKTHCFLHSLLQSNTRARKGKTRGTIEINALLEEATKEFTKEHEDRCFLSLLFIAATPYCLMVCDCCRCVYVELSSALWPSLRLTLLHSSSEVLSHKTYADSTKLFAIAGERPQMNNSEK